MVIKRLCTANHQSLVLYLNADHWLRLFLKKNTLLLRRKKQKAQTSEWGHMRSFWISNIWWKSGGVYQLKDIANINQTPLPFILDNGKTYTNTGVVCKTGPSGQDKWQCTLHLTAFADGVPTGKPLIIFRRNGVRLARKEWDSWDECVIFQIPTDCLVYEKVMLE